MKAVCCPRCKKRKPLEGLEHCGSCLSELVENRAKKSLLMLGLMEKVEILCRDNESIGCVCAKFILDKIGFDAVVVKSPGGKAAVILAGSADDIATGFIGSLMGRKAHTAHSGAFHMFEFVSEKELWAYAGMKNLIYAAPKMRGDGLKQAIQGFAQGHPGTIESVVRSAIRMKKMSGEQWERKRKGV